MTYKDPYEAAIEQKKAEEKARLARLAKVQIESAAELMQKHFEDPRYIWHSMLPDSGLALLAASKASGKTLLLLQLADAVARGRDFLGMPTTPTKTLYLQLELSDRRTQQRLSKMGLGDTPDLCFAYRWPTGEEGLQTLADYIIKDGYGLVIIDVLQLLWPLEADTNSYQDTYAVLSPLRQLANDLGVMILMVTHRRKAETADYLDGVIGSVGLTANADVVFSLIRNRGDDEAVLHVDGNDIEARKIALRFSVNPLGFTTSDALPDEVGLTQERRQVLDVIRQRGGSARTHEIAEALGKKDSATTYLLDKLADQGLLVRLGYGQWCIRNTELLS